MSDTLELARQAAQVLVPIAATVGVGALEGVGDDLTAAARSIINRLIRRRNLPAADPSEPEVISAPQQELTDPDFRIELIKFVRMAEHSGAINRVKKGQVVHGGISMSGRINVNAPSGTVNLTVNESS